MRTINTIVTSVGGIVGQGLIKSLKYHNLIKNQDKHQYSILGTDLSYDACGLYRIDKFAIVEKPDHESYIKFLIELCIRNDIHILLIGSDLELPIIAANKEKIENETSAKVVINQNEIIQLCRDKYRTFQFLKDNNLNFIPTCLPDEVDVFLKDNKFPLVVKPREGFGSKQFHIVRDHNELSFAIRSIQTSGWKPIIQKYLNDDYNEYTTGITIDKYGKSIMSSITMRKILKNGQTYKAYIDEFKNVGKICNEIAMKLGGIGPINIQSRIDTDDNKVKILEINPRFSATTPMRAVAGINEPDIIIRNLILNETISILKYKAMVCLRYWNESYMDLKQFEMIKKERKYISNLNSSLVDYF